MQANRPDNIFGMATKTFGTPIIDLICNIETNEPTAEMIAINQVGIGIPNGETVPFVPVSVTSRPLNRADIPVALVIVIEPQGSARHRSAPSSIKAKPKV